MDSFIHAMIGDDGRREMRWIRNKGFVRSGDLSDVRQFKKEGECGGAPFFQIDLESVVNYRLLSPQEAKVENGKSKMKMAAETE